MSQPIDALGLAQRVRTEGQALRREIARLPHHESKARVAEMLREPSEAIARMRLSSLLTSIRKVSDHSAVRIMDAAGVTRGAWTRRVGPVDVGELTLTERQRLALAAELER